MEWRLTLYVDDQNLSDEYQRYDEDDPRRWVQVVGAISMQLENVGLRVTRHYYPKKVNHAKTDADR